GHSSFLRGGTNREDSQSLWAVPGPAYNEDRARATPNGGGWFRGSSHDRVRQLWADLDGRSHVFYLPAAGRRVLPVPPLRRLYAVLRPGRRRAGSDPFHFAPLKAFPCARPSSLSPPAPPSAAPTPKKASSATPAPTTCRPT